MICKFVKLLASASMPTKAHPSDAGFDLYATESIRVECKKTALIDTGIAIELPPGWCASVRPRSSLNKHGIVCGIGLIDPAYRGPIGVTLTNTHDWGSYFVSAGDRIAQLVIEQVHDVVMVEVDELSPSDRGQSGFGSSGR